MNTYERMCRDLEKLKTQGRFLYPSAGTPIEADPQAKLTFAVWGDPQIAAWSPLRAARLYSACEDIARMSRPLDALILAGDLTDNGQAAEFKMLQALLCSHASGFQNLLCVSGNHDVRLRSFYRQRRIFAEFVEGIPGGIAGNRRVYYHKAVLCGYTFLLLGTDRSTFEEAYISSAQLQWLDAQLAQTARDSVVFVVNHQTLKNTNGLPDTWLGKGDWRGTVGRQSDALRAVIEKYRNVFLITGHLHYGASASSFEDCGTFKSLSAPTIGVVNHGQTDAPTQGYVVQVYDDHIRLRARVFGEGRYLPDDLPGADITVAL